MEENGKPRRRIKIKETSNIPKSLQIVYLTQTRRKLFNPSKGENEPKVPC